MPLRNPIEKAVNAIVSLQNDDGGIPAILHGKPSGTWTTSSCLESFILCRYTPVYTWPACIRMVNFLLSMQLQDGSWPLVISNRGSLMSTAHTISALALVR